MNPAPAASALACNRARSTRWALITLAALVLGACGDGSDADGPGTGKAKGTLYVNGNIHGDI